MAQNTLSISREHIYLAALLHDVGKIGQRAINERPSDTDLEFLCPKAEGGFYTHLHVWWTQKFFELIGNIGNELNWEEIQRLAKLHHKPNDYLTGLISYADRLSSAVDRNYGKDEQRKDFRSVNLMSILSRVLDNPNLVYFDLVPLSSENVYPTKHSNTANAEKYKTLWNGLLNDFKKLKISGQDGFDNFDFTLLNILRRYMWAVPADTQSLADISLFEHSKTTAALAVSTFDFCQKYTEKCQISGSWLYIDKNVFPYALVGIDISGIQDFIYNIISNKAAKSLKGRSFYLELLTLSLIEKFKDIFQAFNGQIIYSSGGKFYALVANIDIRQKIEEFQLQVDRQLWQEHREKLAVLVDAIEFNFDPQNKRSIYIKGKELPVDVAKLWAYLTVAINEKKNRKFFYVINSDNQEDFNLFKPKIIYGNTEVCSVTGIELDEKNRTTLDEHSDVPVSLLVRKQVDLGTALKSARWLIYSKKPINQQFDASIKVLDTYFYLTSIDMPPFTEVKYKALIFNNAEEFLDDYQPGNGYGYIFYAGNKVPAYKTCNGEREKTTDQLTLANDGKSHTMLGVLRMDVDDLGAIFAQGLPSDQRSFSAMSTLSFLLNLFFTKYLSEHRQKNDKDKNYRDWVNILYAGGDDLFIYGRWWEVLEFAQVVRQQFRQFTGNDSLTISAGLVFTHGKFPISKAAQLAQEAEDKAKEGNKNAITFFGRRVAWTDFEEVKNYKTNLVNFINAKFISKGFLQRMIEFDQIRQTGDKSFLWTSLYYLARVSERLKKRKDAEKAREFIITLMKALLQNPKLYSTLALASRWAEKELKTFKTT